MSDELVMLEEFHLSFYLPKWVPRRAARDARRALNDKQFRRRLLRLARRLCGREPGLALVKVRLSR